MSDKQTHSDLWAHGLVRGLKREEIEAATELVVKLHRRLDQETA